MFHRWIAAIRAFRGKHRRAIRLSKLSGNRSIRRMKAKHEDP
jgi:hypothetical protein